LGRRNKLGQKKIMLKFAKLMIEANLKMRKFENYYKENITRLGCLLVATLMTIVIIGFIVYIIGLGCFFWCFD
jgi:uncharacterized membrane protein